MPLLRRLPKRGFNSRFKKSYQVVNVESLNRFGANSTVGPAEMKEAGLIGSVAEPVKILGGGKIEKALTVKAHKFSGSAKKLLESAGVKIELLIK
jgi:large subunit ribosomal protein L15